MAAAQVSIMHKKGLEEAIKFYHVMVGEQGWIYTIKDINGFE
jgi:hypothetical protein